ncbi:hypothetical protein DKP76_07010 [Falsochrobactrum shanghaiense]|uniref:Uncharacterized protein n=1 Tax=Falsochrobactrum shanghaiense TaxID=2201899 RepID=A0A316JBS0_9HYPH|nr:hypothetical protein [Falsochrobactrum shanghaiense]PWL18806.1 hypothetical protein DKP76_07010 [Falsochrobactrum shanghaiense]
MTLDLKNGVKTYSIYGDYSHVNIAAFSQYIMDSVDFLTYWNNLPLLFIVKTKLSVSEVAIKCAPFFSNAHYLVAEINPLGVNGRLPTHAWNWFASPAPAQKTPAPAYDLAALLSIDPPKK